MSVEQGQDAVILYDAGGTALAVQDGVAIPVATSRLLLAGSDYAVASPKAFTPKVDSLGNLYAITSAVSQNTVTGLASGTISLGGGSSGNLQVIRATTYNEPTANGQRSIVSSSASDAAAGVGARSVKITYLDATGAGPFTETLALNGVTPVNTASLTICFIEKMEVLTVGTTGSNVGTITLLTATGGGGTVIGTIGIGNIVAAVGDNQTLWAHHYVPVSRVSRVSSILVASIAAGVAAYATFFLKAQALPVGTNSNLIVSQLLRSLGPLNTNLTVPLKVTGPARIAAFGIPGANNETLSASFDYTDLSS
jgi:hypothetical protein